MKSNFLKRAITGVLFVVVLVGCILYSPLSFGILFTIIGALSVHEFGHLINQSSEVPEKEESHRQLGFFHAEPAIRGIAVCAAQCIGFPI